MTNSIRHRCRGVLVISVTDCTSCSLTEWRSWYVVVLRRVTVVHQCPTRDARRIDSDDVTWLRAHCLVQTWGRRCDADAPPPPPFPLLDSLLTRAVLCAVECVPGVCCASLYSAMHLSQLTVQCSLVHLAHKHDTPSLICTTAYRFCVHFIF